MNSKYRSMSLFLILLMLGGFLVSCYEGTVDSNIISNESNKGLVKLNGVTVISENVEVFYDEETNQEYALIPVDKLLEQLGVKTKWKNSYLLELMFDGKKWALNTNEVILMDGNKNEYYINDLGGGKSIFYSKPKQLILNHLAINALLIEIGDPYYFEIDNDKKIVNLVKR